MFDLSTFLYGYDPPHTESFKLYQIFFFAPNNPALLRLAIQYTSDGVWPKQTDQ